MDATSKHHSAQLGWKSFHFRSWRSCYHMVIQLLRQTASPVLFHINGTRHVRMVRRGDELQFLFGSAYFKWVFLHYCSIGDLFTLMTTSEKQCTNILNIGRLDVDSRYILLSRASVR